ncbi:hypothetical protein CI102_175 [Trichoderma harzianum]|uniref:DUF6604 domain-containing protein n=1 Tax=Trichoderma harzianum CBS 226.95 TaxID=983964 RepID=A0A2T4ALX4_TRIHA|nr:hypothetical protein M431DRAFT_79333 [Trichoderma harzianum CBS 226.95]PKK55151.1 hypothetical protein CI102_175 [Trichoderma harzianum]PTB57868.1 hypothetical protein M431DRAFT_79333 [Trichoderma harzianum CBS 226.95]
MQINNFYVLYKQDTRLLLYWLVKTSNGIIQSQDAAENETPLENFTGQVPVADLVSMAEIIAKHDVEIPSMIFSLFQSVIELRSIYHSQFQQLASVHPNEELERNNVTHKYFIDTLTTAFNILGGEAWLSSHDQEKQAKSDEEEAGPSIFTTANKFSVLNLESDPESDGANHEESDKESSSVASPQQKRRKRAGKGKRKKVNGKKTRRKSSRATNEPLDEVPLESYRIIEDNEMTEYVMAVLALTRDWIQLRSFLQDFWQRVAYKNLNTAVAATTAKIAVGMVKQSESTIFVDFPGYESFEMVMHTLTQGDVKKAEKEFRLTIEPHKGEDSAKTTEVSLDIKELFLIHAYEDLVDFITDYQKTRSGKPTKRMLAQLDKWHPHVNLKDVTKEQRIKWRRSYTINWLYDLVNVTACAALFGKDAKGEDYVLDQVDWSNAGPLKSHHRMFGLIDFAAEVTTLAMQKPGTAFSHKIPSHLVFYLQCIMDAWTISRGWTISGVEGHIIIDPAKGFHPRRDLKIFLGQGDPAASGHGFFLDTENLKSTYQRFQTTDKAFEHTMDCIVVLEKLGIEFNAALGRCLLFQQLGAVLPSRFSATSFNGVWDYSPFLCGAGLAEAIELTYRSIMVLWDRMREPMLVLHLHNMLVQKGYLTRPISVYNRLDDVFSESFYYRGVRPKDKFVENFQAHVHKMVTRKEFLQDRANRRATSTITSAREFLGLVVLRLFKQKSTLLLYQEADWDPSRIPDCDIEPWSALGMIRLNQTRRFRNSASCPWTLEKTELVKRAHFAGMDELFSRNNEEIRDSEFMAEMVLSMLWNDIHGDLCGGLRPLSSLNYLWITIRFLQYFEELEKEAETSGSAMIRALYSTKEPREDLAAFQGDKRLLVSLRALDGKDDELLKTMAKTFEKCGGTLANFMYWPEEAMKAIAFNEPVIRARGHDCCVM